MGGGAPPAKAEELATPVVQGLLSVGVLCCFSVSSLTQEALTSKRYGAEEAPFHFKNFLLFAQSVAAAAVALGMLARGAAPARATASGTTRAGYPVHVTFKSCKAIPVVIGERLLTTKRHGAAKLCGVFAMYAGYQTALVSRCASEWTLMLHMNAWQGLLSYATCWSNGDEASRALAFVRAHPDVSLDLGAFLVSKALGTLCVYKLLRESGTIVVATITTLRKVLSVLLSVAIFGHAVGPVQWAALALVFLHKYVGEYAAAALVERKKPKAA
ncbi:UDP-galactose transmembrane transporter [Aureococcus anophagefferens]|nr:UDP-galactose transmembrane transporter [Aureococcus anophagefferens]